VRLPSYTYLSREDWDKRIRRCDEIARSCRLCPRNCGVNRFGGERGFCRAPGGLVVSGIFPHHGEEPPISGGGGSGTVFFSCCTLQCCFCQNYQLSHLAEGQPSTPENLAEQMLHLQERGCHNINLVTATHFLPWVLRALQKAVADGLSVPIVYNCGGYEYASTVRLLNGIVDIYLPDMKYGDDSVAQRYSNAQGYTGYNTEAVKEMFRQVGPLRTDNNGVAFRGLCIRHLVLPGNHAATEKIVAYLTATFDPEDIYITLMAQYRPLFKANRFGEIDRMVTADEYSRVREMVEQAGFPGFFQDVTALDRKFVIDFTKRKDQALTGDDD
jgi:putative pyruvate formate lyase activating enzyme